MRSFSGLVEPRALKATAPCYLFAAVLVVRNGDTAYDVPDEPMPTGMTMAKIGDHDRDVPDISGVVVKGKAAN